MNALTDITAASPVALEYYQRLYKAAPWSVKEELASMIHLLIGTCGVSDQTAAFLCADRACRVFAPAQLRTAGFEKEAEKVESSAEINSRATSLAATKEDCGAAYASNAYAANAAFSAAYAADAANAAAYSAAYPDSASYAASAYAANAAYAAAYAANAANAAYYAAMAATPDNADPINWPAAIQLFKDLCALPRD